MAGLAGGALPEPADAVGTSGLEVKDGPERDCESFRSGRRIL
ncbi:hypothetical protein HMPREF0058_2310 [Actinomyces urogenitalis DSM 15434]|uniref:Uncharacterized protein n=1 Tax=Actinomyces urogenitalis DSM 15434 TaxID=525246 RepID=C0W8W6_9ACTO|nr:hypothetical protein HMPREF0058_2310 [Actinomyces urogenitalis DSM 15434]